MSVRILQGDCRDVLKSLPDESVHCVVTSPPYWGLRDYGVDGQLGLELTPAGYVETMTAVFADARRVLRNDGTLWLNLGDSYARMQEGNVPQSKNKDCPPPFMAGRVKNAGLKPKDLVGIPWRVAFALQEDGWYLRSEITWCKRAPMPESVQDRPTSATEKIFLMSKSERYWYDSDAVRETSIEPQWESRLLRSSDKSKPTEQVNGIRQRTDKQRGHSRRHAGFNDRWDAMEKTEQQAGGRNMRNWWLLGPEPFPEAHFATFPSEVPQRCILAGCPAGGVVLDPFGGAGTTGLVADRMGRDAILIELNPEYADMARKRIVADGPLFADVA